MFCKGLLRLLKCRRVSVLPGAHWLFPVLQKVKWSFLIFLICQKRVPSAEAWRHHLAFVFWIAFFLAFYLKDKRNASPWTNHWCLRYCCLTTHMRVLKVNLSSWPGHWVGAWDAQGHFSLPRLPPAYPWEAVSSLCLSFHEQKEDKKQLHLIKMMFHSLCQAPWKRSSAETIVMGPTTSGDASPLNGKKNP